MTLATSGITAEGAATAPSGARQTAIGLALAGLILGAWIANHGVAVYLVPWGTLPTAAMVTLGAALIVLQAWLFVGLFIVAHDCMHGSLAPGRPAINRWVGRLVLALYAGFFYDKLLPEHHKHHRRPGTEQDPDFDADHPRNFWLWFAKFMRHYYGLRELVTVALGVNLYVYLTGADFNTVMVFYAVPAVLSAIQLFYFGTYRPHRHEDDGFADDHNSRTDDFPWALSLLTCFHFGYHHEHHLAPTTPWWRLPVIHSAQRTQGR